MLIPRSPTVNYAAEGRHSNGTGYAATGWSPSGRQDRIQPDNNKSAGLLVTHLQVATAVTLVRLDSKGNAISLLRNWRRRFGSRCRPPGAHLDQTTQTLRCRRMDSEDSRVPTTTATDSGYTITTATTTTIIDRVRRRPSRRKAHRQASPGGSGSSEFEPSDAGVIVGVSAFCKPKASAADTVGSATGPATRQFSH